MKYAFFLLAALPAFPQMMGMRPPEIPGIFHPVVGAGAEYHITGSRRPASTVAFAVVGQEEGGYWLEVRSNNNGKAVVMKELMTGQPPQAKRMILQANGRPPMEMPMSMASYGAAVPHAGGTPTPGGGAAGSIGTRIGVETITVAAGTFECEHYSSESNGKHSDVWISTKVAPYGLIKATSADSNIELQKVLEHETSQITGEPMQLNIPGR